MIALLFLACAGPAASAPRSPAPPEPAVATPLTSAPALSFEDGPAVDPAAPLLAWLSAGRGRVVQLPVTVAFDDEFRLGVARAWVGPESGGLRLKLDDTAMGVSLLDRLRAACPPGPTCRVWLEGTWGPLMDGMPDFGDSDPGRHDFTVRRFVGLADDGATRARGALG